MVNGPTIYTQYTQAAVKNKYTLQRANTQAVDLPYHRPTHWRPEQKLTRRDASYLFNSVKSRARVAQSSNSDDLVISVW